MLEERNPEVERLSKKFSKNGYFYGFLRRMWTTPNFKRHYRHIYIAGKENIPNKGPIIYALNHQNSLMDAMAVVSTQKHQTVFVARADIFKKSFIIKVLHFLRILPIYRRRDGGRSVDNNQETFEIVDHILKAQKVLGIMPEGVFNPFRRLNVLQKGIFRTALKAQEAFGSEGGVVIIPVGLNWQNPQGAFKDLTIFYGKPIPVSEYFSAYEENPAKAFLQLQERLSDEMRKLIVNIPTDKYYDTVNALRDYFSKDIYPSKNHPYCFLEAQQNIVDKMIAVEAEDESKMADLTDLVRRYTDGLEKLKIRNWLLRAPSVSIGNILLTIFLMIIASPIALIGGILGLLPLSLARKYEAVIKDPQFRSSVRYVVSMCLRGIQNLILYIVLLFVVSSVWQYVIAVAFILYTERFMMFYCEYWKRLKGKIRYRRLVKAKDARILELQAIRKELLKPIA